MTSNAASRPSHQGNLFVADQSCPVCSQLIPNEKLDEVRVRLVAREAQLSAAATASAAQRFDVEKQELVLRHAEALASQTHAFNMKLAAAREDEKRKVEAAAQAQIATLQKANVEANSQWQVKYAALAAERAEALKECEVLKADAEGVIGRRVQEVREALDLHYLEQSNAKDAAHAAEKQALTGKVADLARQLEKKTADELGEGAEVKLYESLRREFQEDRIERVGKGNPGADIVHTILSNGRECGRIVYDSKNAQAWRNEYVTKLVQDQIAAQADHAILCVLKFPAQSKQLDIRDGVIVVNPARALAVVRLLRKHLIEVSNLRLSKNERARKMGALYDFIMSKRCRQLLGRFDAIADALLKAQEAEVRAHEETWRRQGLQFRAIQKVAGDLEAEIDRIIESEDEAEIAS